MKLQRRVYDENWDGGRTPLERSVGSDQAIRALDNNLIGRRIKERRLFLKLTVTELAEGSSLTRQTIISIEKGLSCRGSSLKKILFVLGLYWSDLIAPEPECSFAVFFDVQSASWKAAFGKEQYTTPPKGEEEHAGLDDEVERHRLGNLGLVPFFGWNSGCQLPHGVIRSPAIMELHQPSWFDQHPGEECAYCLRGRVKIIVSDREYVLNEGCFLIFKGMERHKYVPLELSHDGRAPLLFMVMTNTPDDAVNGVRKWVGDG